jgi:hypothetical protein
MCEHQHLQLHQGWLFCLDCENMYGEYLGYVPAGKILVIDDEDEATATPLDRHHPSMPNFRPYEVEIVYGKSVETIKPPSLKLVTTVDPGDKVVGVMRAQGLDPDLLPNEVATQPFQVVKMVPQPRPPLTVGILRRWIADMAPYLPDDTPIIYDDCDEYGEADLFKAEITTDNQGNRVVKLTGYC